MTREIKDIEIGLLKPHLRNESIYGQEDVSDLMALIEERGRIVDNLVINKDHIIISGHRRWLAATKLGYTTVPCEIVSFDSAEDELEELIHYNAGREKTFEQRIRESITLEEVYSEKAKKRSLSNLKQNNADMDNLTASENPHKEDTPKGSTRDIVAKKAGLSSGKTYNRGKNVIIAVDKLRNGGNHDDADLLLAILNKSVSAAEDLANEDNIKKLSEDDKHNLKLGKVTVRSLLPKEKTPKTKKKPSSAYASAKEHIKVINSNIKALNRIKATENTDEQKSKIRESIESTIESLKGILNEYTQADKYSPTVISGKK